MIIYPPIIGDTIPAFTNAVINIPYSDNMAVVLSEVKGFNLLIKELLNSEIVCSINSVAIPNDKLIQFRLNETNLNKLVVGNYYKFQIAYLDYDNNPSPYSSTSVGRYVGEEAELIINNLIENKKNPDQKEYVGTYSNGLTTEPIYQYKFDLIEESEIDISPRLKPYINDKNYSSSEEGSVPNWYQDLIGGQYIFTYNNNNENEGKSTSAYIHFKNFNTLSINNKVENQDIFNIYFPSKIENFVLGMRGDIDFDNDTSNNYSVNFDGWGKSVKIIYYTRLYSYQTLWPKSYIKNSKALIYYDNDTNTLHVPYQSRFWVVI
jgi:hypothetical protein